MTPLLVFTAAWVFSIVLAQAAFFHPIWFLLALPAALVLHFGWRDQPAARLNVWALAGLLAGAARFQLSYEPIDATHVAYYNATPDDVTITGVVTGEPSLRATRTHLTLTAEQLRLPDGDTIAVRGQVLIYAPRYTAVQYGDRIAATGLPETPPVYTDFSYRDVLARRHIYTLMDNPEITELAAHQANPAMELLYRFKAYALQRLLMTQPEPQASLLAGILLGVETGIPEALQKAFATTGTSHIVAISGANLTLVAGIFAALARRIGGRKRELALTVTAVWLYTLLVGAAAAVVRAAIMASLALLARHEERKIHGPTALAAAALAMSAWDPMILWDLGFQLSLAATAGLVLFTEPLTRLCLRGITLLTHKEPPQQLPGWLSEVLILTLAAQLTTTPVLAASFGQLSLITLLTNFLILPLQSAIMLLGGLSLLSALLAPLLGQIIGWAAWVPLTATTAIVQATAAVPFASVPLVRLPAHVHWAYYLLIAGIRTWVLTPAARRREWLATLVAVPRLQAAGAGIGIVLIGAAFSALPDGRLHCWFLNVGQGEALFIQTPQGQQILVDGGPDPRQYLSEIGSHLPFWDRRLDGVILTSPDSDALLGLIPVLERYRVDTVMTGAESGGDETYARWGTLLAARPPETIKRLDPGTVWELEPGVTLEVLWPDSAETPGPLVLRLVHGETSLLFAANATTVVEEALAARYGSALDSDVLQVPMNGAKTSCTPAFIQAVTPEVAVISAEADNWQGVPAPQTLARLKDTAIYRTDQHGAVEVISDGQTFRIEPEREGF